MTTEDKAHHHAVEAFREFLQAEHSNAGLLRDAIEKAYLAGAAEALRGQWKDAGKELPEDDESRERIDTGISQTLLDDFLARVEYKDGSYDHFVANRKKFEESEWLWWDSERDLELRGVTHWLPIPSLPNTEEQ